MSFKNILNINTKRSIIISLILTKTKTEKVVLKRIGIIGRFWI